MATWSSFRAAIIPAARPMGSRCTTSMSWLVRCASGGSFLRLRSSGSCSAMPDSEPIRFALNQKTLPQTTFLEFLDIAADLGCVGVEARNDLARPLFDGISPLEAGKLVRERGLRLIGVSEVFPFDDWTEERRDLAKTLLRCASEAGAETVSLIPRVDGQGPSMFGSPVRHQDILSEILAIADGGDITLLIEPIGFPGSAIRFQGEAAECISE